MHKTIANTLVAISSTFIALSGAGCAEDPGPAKAESRVAESAIVGGQLESGWLGVGALTKFEPGSGYDGSFCTGTLITNEWVLTAAHCVAAEDGELSPTPSLTYFYLGTDARPVTSNGPGTGTLYAVDAFVTHPDYNAATLSNDIALVHLSNPISDAVTYPINAAVLDLVGAQPSYVGYGATEGINGTGGGLKRSNIHPLPIVSVFLNVFASDFEGSGTCFGDSGGPVLLDVNGTPTVVGVNSGGGTNCDPSTPGCPADPCHGTSFATRLDVHAAWVNSVTGSPLPNCNGDPSICFCSAACQGSGSCDNSVCQTNMCADVYGCLGDCDGDQACDEACYAAGTDEAKADFDSLLGCLSSSCGGQGLEGQALEDCAFANCQSQVDMCFPPVSGTASCEDIQDCSSGCTDQACLDACFETGSPLAQSQFSAMQTCFSEECSGLSADEFTPCAYANCPTQINACFPPCNIAGGECAAGTACYLSNGVTTCIDTAGIPPGAACAPGTATLSCTDGYVCLDGTCQHMCTSDADCGSGLLCTKPLFVGNTSIGVCACADEDGDEFCAPDDCNDNDPSIHPGADEICGDGIDQDCWEGDTLCAPDPTPDTAGDNGGAVDAGPSDTTDGDTAVPDTGPTDTGPTDAGPSDTTDGDTAVPDTGPTDTGPTDTDAQEPDASSDSATTPDTHGPSVDVTGPGDSSTNADTFVPSGANNSRNGGGCTGATHDGPFGMMMGMSLLLGIAFLRRRG